MADYIIPILDSAGSYTFLPPFNDLVGSEEIYHCRAVRKVEDWLHNGQKPLEMIYEPMGLSEEDMDEDAKAGIPIVSLQNNAGTWYNIPARYITSLPTVNGRTYRGVSLVAQLPILDESLDLSNLKDQISNLIKDNLGVVPEVTEVITTRTMLLDESKYIPLEIKRNELKDHGASSDRARWLSTLDKLNIANARIEALETYIAEQ